MNLKNASFMGSIQGEGNVSVSLDATSTWTLTADTYVSSFDGDIVNVITNGFKLFVNGEAII